MAQRPPIRTWTGVVLNEWVDYNRHMSEGYYGLVFCYASDNYLLRMGFDEHYRSLTGGSFYTVETHITFNDELWSGAALAVNTTVASADIKRVHLFHELRRAEDGHLAATQESMMLHVDTTIDKVRPMGEALYAILRNDADAHGGLLTAGAIGRSIRGIGA